ncbi:PKD domain-containing protein [Flavobacteriales bacterium]|nr:PKD domain-containing protein [Flavobacteriales bacterium]
MKKLLLTTITSLTILFGQAQTTLCDSLTITGSHNQLQITAMTNTFIYDWYTVGYGGNAGSSILQWDSSMSTTHNVYNFNTNTGQPYDTLLTCISTMNTFCCDTLVWNGNNWIISSGSNPPPPPLNCNANFYWWQNFDSTLNTFTTDIYCVENSTGGTGPFTYNWVFGDGNTSNLQYPTHIYNQVGDYNLCLTYTDANGCSSNYCDTITISSKSSGYTLNVIDENQINTLDILNSEPKNNSKIYPNPVNNLSFLDYSCDKNTNLSLTYIDYSGNIIKNENVKISSGNNKIELSTKELTNGLYFLKINGENHVETLSFIK